MNYYLLALLIWMAMLGVIFWRRKVFLRKTAQERELERIRRQWWWAGNSLSVIICKFLLLVGLVCVVANVVLQGLDIHERHKRMRKYKGRISFRIVKQRVNNGVCICRAELYNGRKGRIRVEHLLPDRGEVRSLGVANGRDDGVAILNKAGVDAPVIILPFDHAMTVDFSVGTNLLPRFFSINYTTPSGVLTNAVLYLDKVQNEKKKVIGVRP